MRAWQTSVSMATQAELWTACVESIRPAANGGTCGERPTDRSSMDMSHCGEAQARGINLALLLGLLSTTLLGLLSVTCH